MVRKQKNGNGNGRPVFKTEVGRALITTWKNMSKNGNEFLSHSVVKVRRQKSEENPNAMLVELQAPSGLFDSDLEDLKEAIIEHQGKLKNLKEQSDKEELEEIDVLNKGA